ncbi:MAG: ParM/StbA family protein [Chloroflexota bacterium]|nr:ParM/StbA family protein [Chloroflexota bacterium]
MKKIHVPSTVGVGSTDLGGLTLGDFSKGHRTEIPHKVVWGQTSSYLVGENVAQFTRPLESLNFQRFSDGLGMRALTYASLGLLLGGGEHTVSIMAGLPVEVLEDDDLAQKTKRSLRIWLEGKHTFTVDGTQTHLHVKRVATMPQPAGTFFAWGLNDQGDWTKTEDDFEATVAICDVGFNTLDVFTLQGGKILRRFTGGDTAGMRRAVELLLRSLEAQYKVKYSLQEADALIRAGDAIISIAGGKVDLIELITAAKKAAGAGINTFLDEHWGNGRQFEHVIFTGGGAAALKNILIEQYPLGYMLPDPVNANALGLARYGRRVFNIETVIGLDPGFGGFKVVQL